MDLYHDILTQQEAANELKVRVNGQVWTATRVRIVRRTEGDRIQWVHMVIVDEGGMQMEYFMERLNMIFAWKSLYANTLTKDEINNLVIELNGSKCKALDVAFQKIGTENWVEMHITCYDGSTQKIAIEVQSMINAFYALRTSIEDLFETGVAIIEKIISDM